MIRFLISWHLCFLLLLLFNNAFPQSQKASNNLSQKSIQLEIDDYVELRKLNTNHFWRQVDTLIYIDSIFNLENIGMDRITVELNGYRFRLTIDPYEVNLGDNIFLMPENGTLVFNIGEYLNPDPEVTIIRFNYQGQIGDSSHILIGDVVLPGEEVDFVLELKELPKKLGISQNFPNPFNDFTDITFTIPDSWLNGAEVDLSIYNLLGQKVRTLFRGRRLYGDFNVRWDGRNSQGIPVASGVYLYRISARGQQIVKRMIAIK